MSWIFLVLACGPRVGDYSHHGTGTTTTPDGGTTDTATSTEVRVVVLLDGEPSPDTTVVQGGNPQRWTTAQDGTVTVEVDLTIEGDLVLMASHPEARIAGDFIPDEGQSLTIELVRFDPSDNADYRFQPPGEPGVEQSTEYCSHCHVTMVSDWYGSPHRGTASNPTVHDLYSGAAAALTDEGSCVEGGGQWREGIGPGTAAAAWRCYVGEGVLPELSPGCEPDCDVTATVYGACADCHAPGIDGELGGRHLLEATGTAYNDGVHCDVCHLVESIDPDAPAGVAGRLHIVRPSEESTSFAFQNKPLTFGPYPDVLNPRMGSVERSLFTEGEYCSGCHELDQEVLVPGQALDLARWPDGTLPVHSTYSEWVESGQPSCQDCHMPPDTEAGNSADLQNVWVIDPGITGGWMRPVGSVRKHSWYGPRQPDAGLLESAAALTVRESATDDELIVTVTVSNVGAGHAIPTGEPLRSVILLVEASCGTVPLRPTGGDAVPDHGGAADQQDASGDWSRWPEAEVGDVVRVVEQTGAWHLYQGHGPFGDGSFDAEGRGQPVEHVKGYSTIVGLPDEDGGPVVFDRPLPAGTRAYRVPPDGLAHAGSPGFAFARVMVDALGRRMTPHFLAVDVASDNRLLFGDSYTTEHRFEWGCSAPAVKATLVHRAWPWWLARERGWGERDEVMAVSGE